MKASIYRNDSIPQCQQQAKSRFKLKQLSDLVKSKSKQPKLLTTTNSLLRLSNHFNQMMIPKKQIFLTSQIQGSVSVSKSLTRSKSRLGITLKNQEKINPMLQSKESSNSQSSRKQKLSLISKSEKRNIASLLFLAQQQQTIKNNFTNSMKDHENKQNFHITSNLQNQPQDQQLDVQHQKINQKQHIHYSRPIKTTRQIIELKMQKQREKKKIKIEKKINNKKNQQIRM